MKVRISQECRVRDKVLELDEEGKPAVHTVSEADGKQLVAIGRAVVFVPKEEGKKSDKKSDKN